MKLDRALRILHVVVTVQFAGSAALIVSWSFHQTGLHWWAFLSLSVPGVALVILGVLIYGFAVARGVVGERSAGEHAFTGGCSYRIFYLVVPVLGGLVGALFYLATEGWAYAPWGAALGTVIPACMIWLGVDPLVGIIESALPHSRKFRGERRAQERRRRARRAREREEVLEKVRADYRARIERERPLVSDRAERLSALLLGVMESRSSADECALIGLAAWQIGGVELMQELYAETFKRLQERQREDLAAHLDYLWDGVGSWRQNPLIGKARRLATPSWGSSL